ncbi:MULTISPECIES: endonuclease/exonuclease/phosphatase family protein [Phyllobacteriaceae]|jgi:endonuclease/exonuclease/phosphatase (EEP) superfamily protein YafD|nr:MULTISPECIES: endonuclease/exonuclease/phosphatase family protein [Mesorhizobium]MDQ0332205.1 endonuclease/exonuclease/phosphatase (EEP) superfamily protein YafD [Mesorhizobium sp. YL-MeA3-2017]
MFRAMTAMDSARILFQFLIAACAVASSVALLAGFFGAFHPALDSFSHFRTHLAALLVLLALVMIIAGPRWQAVPFLVFAIACLATTTSLPGLGKSQAGFTAKPDDRAVYRLLQMNLRYNNPTPEKVLSLIDSVKPDVVTLNEVSDMWAGKLKLLSGVYPYSIACPFPNGFFGVALLSRQPFVEGSEPQCNDRGSMATAHIDFGGTEVAVAAVHIGWPWPFNQFRQIRSLSHPLATLGEDAVVAGDFNAVPWSEAVQRFARAGALTLVPSAGPTWFYRRLPAALSFAGLPIDQVLYKGAVVVHSATLLEDTGSDHRPVLVEFSLKPAAAEPEGGPKTATVSAERPEQRKLVRGG